MITSTITPDLDRLCLVAQRPRAELVGECHRAFGQAADGHELRAVYAWASTQAPDEYPAGKFSNDRAVALYGDCLLSAE